jgi:hypothetical protein
VEALTERVARRITKRVRKLVEEEEVGGTRLEETAPLPLAPARVGERELRLWTGEEGSAEWDESEAYRRRWEAESGEGVSEWGPP